MSDNELVFYYPDGTRIEPVGTKDAKQAFIDFYSRCYYLRVAPKDEKEVEAILFKSDRLIEDDVGKILVWKTGGKLEGKLVKSRSGPVSVSDVASKLQNEPRGNCSESTAERLLSELTTLDHIGPVYAITLLYFLTQGHYPIYDQFAQMAITAIKEKPERKKPGERIPYHALSVSKTWIKSYFNFQRQIYSVFCRDEYQSSRNIDRALWGYGHLFHAKKGVPCNGLHQS